MNEDRRRAQRRKAAWIRRTNKLVKSVPCTCGAKVGKQCILSSPVLTRTGRKRTEAIGPHHERVALARAISQAKG